MLIMYMTIAPNTDMVTILAVSGCPRDDDEVVAEDCENADHAAGENGDPGRLEARMNRRKNARQITGARQREDLPRIAQDDAVEGRDEAEQTERHQHVQPAAFFADDEFHRLRQRIVDVRKLGPVAGGAREQHHADGQSKKRQNAGDIGDRNRTLRILRLFGRHGDAFDREEEPDRERDRGEHAAERSYAEVILARPAALDEIGDGEAGADDAHEDQQFEDRQHGDDKLERRGDGDANDIERHENEIGAERGAASDRARETAH